MLLHGLIYFTYKDCHEQNPHSESMALNSRTHSNQWRRSGEAEESDEDFDYTIATMASTFVSPAYIRPGQRNFTILMKISFCTHRNSPETLASRTLNVTLRLNDWWTPNVCLLVLWDYLDGLSGPGLTLVSGICLGIHTFPPDFPALLCIGFCSRIW